MKPKIGIVIPALNEEATVGDVVKGCLSAASEAGWNATIFVVNDGSDDSTALRARQAGATVVDQEHSRGVGRAFRRGLEQALGAGAELIISIDADGQLSPADMLKVAGPILAGRADFVTGSRFSTTSPANVPLIKRFGNAVLSRLVGRMTGQRLTDVSCGLRAYGRDAALRLSLNADFTHTQEAILDLAAKGLRLAEVPVKVQRRSSGESRVAQSVLRYAVRAGGTILHVCRDLWPQFFFGWMTGLCALPGVGLLVFLGLHRLRTGAFSPHIWAGFVGGGLVFVSLLVAVLGFVAEMLKRIRLNQETLLYYERRRAFSGTHPER